MDTRTATYIVIPALGVPMLFILLTGMLFYYSFRKPKKSGQQLLEEFKKKEDKGPEKRSGVGKGGDRL